MNKAKMTDLLPDYLLSIPVAVSLAANLFNFFLIPQSQKSDFKAVLLYVSVFLLLIYGILYNKLTLKIFIAASVIGAGIYLSAFYYFFRRPPLISYAMLLNYLFQIVIFGTCVAVYFGGKYLWSVLILLAGGLTMFFYMSFNKIEPETKTYYLFLAGAVALLAKKLIGHRLKIKSFKEFAEIYGYSLLAAAIVLTVAHFIYMQTDFRIRRTTVTPQPSIKNYEDLDSMEHFGARLALNDDVALTVDSSADSFYLKSDTFVGYGNSKWEKVNEQSESDLKNIGNYMWMMVYTYEYNRPFFNEHAPSDITTYIDYFKKNKTPFLINKTIIRHKENNFKCLFLPAGFFSFKTQGNFSQPVTEDYSLESHVPADTPYTVTFPQPDLKSPQVMNILSNEDSIVQGILEEWRDKSGGAKKSIINNDTYKTGEKTYCDAINSFNEYSSKMKAQYLELSPSVTKRTKELAASITKNCTDDYEKVMAIKRYLQKNCTYSLTPPQPEKGEDLVDYFLYQSHLGYCAHFASAMTVLLRAADVPARYVCGFVSPKGHLGNKFVVTNEQAHAWVEVYSEALGFYSVDATENINGNSTYTPDVKDKKEKISANTGNNIDMNKKKDLGKEVIPLVAKLCATLFFLLLAFILAAKFIKRRKFKEQGLNAQAIVYYEQLLLILGKFGFKRFPSETLYEFSDKLKWNKDLYEKFTHVTDIYMYALYGAVPIKQDDIKKIVLFRKDVLKYMRFYACLPKYMIIRFFAALSI